MKNKGVLRGKESSPAVASTRVVWLRSSTRIRSSLLFILFAIHLVGEFDGTLLPGISILKANSRQLYARWRKLQDQRGSFKEKAGRFAEQPLK